MLKLFRLVHIVIILFLVTAISAESQSYTARANYNALFEPNGKIIHGAGQTYNSGTPQNTGFERYAETLGSSRFPLVFMDYFSMTSSQSAWTTAKNRMDGIQTTYNKYVIPQIGLYIASGAATPTQSQINNLITGLKTLNRPVYLRIGYEFNGVWYSPMYDPTYYVQSFRMITNAIRANNLPVATLWCAYPGYSSYYGSWSFLSPFYPGNDYVDWWSIDMFSASDITASATSEFLNKAEQYGKPVMIGEATPRYIGADNASDWNSWFSPFFNLIKNRKGIKGHTYINWNWAGTSWPDWGDARLETGDATVRANYINELSNSMYVHAGQYMPSFVVPEPSSISAIGVLAATALTGLIIKRNRKGLK